MTRRLAQTLLSVLGCILCDRLLKWYALSGHVVIFQKGIFTFQLFRNTGIAFSLPFSGPGVWILSAVILLGVGALAARDFKARDLSRLAPFALFLIGALSNLFDRIAYGFTVDYLIFFSRSAVNVADGMIVAGALWLLFANRGAAEKK